MQEIQYDGTERITKNVTSEQLNQALINSNNKTVLVHNAGSIITTKSGTRYEVQSNGEWRKLL